MEESRVIRVTEEEVTRLGFKKPKIIEFASQICERLASAPDKDCVIFPPSASGTVRKFCHEVAEKCQLKHFSVEKDGEKRLIITKVLDPNKLYSPNPPRVEVEDVARDSIRVKVNWTYEMQAPVYRLILRGGKHPLNAAGIDSEMRSTKHGSTLSNASGEAKFASNRVALSSTLPDAGAMRVIVETDAEVTETEWILKGMKAGEVYTVEVEAGHDAANSETVSLSVQTLSPLLGNLYSWGNNSMGAFGYVLPEPLLNQPTALPAPVGTMSIAGFDAGYYHCACLTDKGKIVTWGRLVWTTEDSPDPQAVPSAPMLLSPLLSQVQFCRIACGDTHNLAVSTDGKVFAWGLGNVGELGLGGKTFTAQPEAIERIDEDFIQMPFFVDIACSQLVSLALTLTGAVYEWGFVTHPASPILPTVLSVPKYVKPVLGGSVCVRIAAGSGYKAAILRNQELYMWGQNMAGVLGIGSLDTASCPVKVDLPPIVQISCGTNHAGAITSSEEVYTWGNGDKGQLGHSDYCHSLIPRHLADPLIVHPTALACNGNQTLILLQSGELYACGEGKNACLGIGVPGKAKSPMKVKSSTPATLARLGLQHALATFQQA